MPSAWLISGIVRPAGSPDFAICKRHRRPYSSWELSFILTTSGSRYFYNIPSCSFAASDMKSEHQVGSHTNSTLAEVTPGTARTFASTSPGSEPATGQLGDVRVILIATSPAGVQSTPYTRPSSYMLTGISGS